MMEDIIIANGKLNEWCDTEGINYYEGIEALGFLFKYAVPKVDVVTIDFQEKSCMVWATLNGKSIIDHHEDPALALFWALNSIIDLAP